MNEPNVNPEDPNAVPDEPKVDDPIAPNPQENKDKLDITEIAQKLADEKVAGFKAKVEAAYTERDQVKQEMAALRAEYEESQQASKAAESEQLRKIKEEMTTLKTENDILKQKIILQDKNKAVSDALSGLPFVNDFAKSQAGDFLRDHIRKNEMGTYEHTSGVNLRQYVEEVLVRDKQRNFWFKPRDNEGPDTRKSSFSTPGVPGDVSLLDEHGNPKFTTKQMLEFYDK